jgi:hypothetical protein
MVRMTTDTSMVDRTIDWFLDTDGDLYGDEQERQRWYEGIAIAASIQWIAIPWVATVALFAGGRAVAPALLAVLLALYLPIFVVNWYVGRRHVRLHAVRWGRKRVIITVLALTPYVLLVGGFFWAFDASGSALFGGVFGGVVGLAGGGLAMRLRRRRERAREADPAEVE